jgi:transposase
MINTINDKSWDGLKGYVTNTKLDNEVMENYKNLWHIEKAFRMSKTDLRIRPIYHRLRNRIEAHIVHIIYCILHPIKNLNESFMLKNQPFQLRKQLN